ncbi:MAG: acetylglutamate kinase [Alphaproteobacteria bacterium]
MTSEDKKQDTKRRDAMRRHWLSTARTLQEALPFILNYDKRNVVIKFGGNAMVDDDLATSFAHDIVLLKQVGVNPIVVHGGGPQIGKMLERLNIETEFVDGLRVTDKATVDIVEMILSGSINKSIVTAINRAGGKAIGLSGKDGNLLTAEKTKSRSGADIGYVGEPKAVNPAVLDTLTGSDIIPVIAPVGIGEDGATYNINADTAAGAIAAAVGAKRLLMLTDIAGVLNSDGQLITNVSAAEAEALIDNGTIAGGMIPKIQTCLNAVAKGVEAAVIMDGRIPHTVILELFTEHGTGTLIAEQGAAITREHG